MNRNKKKILLITIVALVFMGISSFAYYKKDSLSKYFQAKGDDCSVYNVLVGKAKDSYSITWNTKSKCSGFVKYGEFSDSLNYTGVNENLNLSSTSHNVTIEKKWDSSYFIIISDNKPYGLGNSPMIIN